MVKFRCQDTGFRAEGTQDSGRRSEFITLGAKPSSGMRPVSSLAIKPNLKDSCGFRGTFPDGLPKGGQSIWDAYTKLADGFQTPGHDRLSFSFSMSRTGRAQASSSERPTCPGWAARREADTPPNLLDLGAAGAPEQTPLWQLCQTYFPRRVSVRGLLLGPLLWYLVEPGDATKVSELLPWEQSLSSILPEMLQVLDNSTPLVSVRCFFLCVFVFSFQNHGFN